MAKRIRSKQGLQNHFQRCPDDVKTHYEHLPELLSNFPMEVALGYVFHRLEVGQVMGLYCGLQKIHRANSELARTIMDFQHITRDGYAELHNTVFNVGLPKDAKSELKTAEGIRDTIMHGGTASDDRLRNAIARVLDYSIAVNDQIDKEHSLRPYAGYWRGAAGGARKLDKRTTRFMLKGMGFSLA